MRTIVITVATLSLAAFASAIEARELSKSHRFACTWGSDIAVAGAQVPATVDAHDGDGHYRADLQQHFEAQAGGSQADLLRTMRAA